VRAQPFFQAMHRALKPGGVICTQARMHRLGPAGPATVQSRASME
jgi:spermidine synthase